MKRGHAEMMEDFGVGPGGGGMPSFPMCKCIYCKDFYVLLCFAHPNIKYF